MLVVLTGSNRNSKFDLVANARGMSYIRTEQKRCSTTILKVDLG
jgi:hypothetical protein